MANRKLPARDRSRAISAWRQQLLADGQDLPAYVLEELTELVLQLVVSGDTHPLLEAKLQEALQLEREVA